MDTSTDNRILTTKGDANPVANRFEVNTDGYIGKMLRHVDYIGEVIRVLYEKYVAVVVVSVAVGMVTAVLKGLTSAAS